MRLPTISNREFAMYRSNLIGHSPSVHLFYPLYIGIRGGACRSLLFVVDNLTEGEESSVLLNRVP